MKILHVLDHSIPLHSGYTFRTRAILNNQRLQGLETIHVTSPKQGQIGSPKETHDDLVFYRSAPLSELTRKLPLFNQLAIIPRLRKRILQTIEEEKPDVIHAHSPALNGIAALQASRKTGLPLVYEVRAFWEDAAVNLGTSEDGGLRYRLTRNMETYVLKKADAVTTICEGLRADIVARGIPSEKVTTIPNAVDLEQFHLLENKNTELLHKLGLENTLVAGFIGSFYEYEGLDILVSALKLSAEKLPNLKLLLVGGGPQEQYLKSLVSEYQLNDRVIFTGRVPHSDVSEYYSLVDVLVYPRKSMRLTELVTPLKPMEAMAQGKLVMASDVGGHRELIDDQQNGYLFKADSPEALSNSLSQFFEQPQIWPKIVENGLNFVHQERNWANSVQRYHTIYNRITSQRHAQQL
ncbi:MAG: glycosyltransferase, exosortase A system-associated [Motiliproteus sp.]|nr:glycosyltransferase, exosortase A system-associated [Motiliproteus sp.]MCW9052389.1 glycosyltransferase, exosortase A system-associated [Motiliproteus sp.]